SHTMPRFAAFCLLSLTFSLAGAEAAPAPFPRASRPREPALTTERVAGALRDLGFRIESIEPDRPGEWFVMTRHETPDVGGLVVSYLKQSRVTANDRAREGEPPLRLKEIELRRDAKRVTK